MRVACAVLSIFALIAIVIAAPSAADARAQGQVAELVGWDDVPDVPTTDIAHEVLADSVTHVVVELRYTPEPSSSRLVTLDLAPKTSPPSH